MNVGYVVTKRKVLCPSSKPCRVSGYRISKRSPICLSALTNSTGESAGEKPACAASTAVQTDALASKHLCLQPVRRETWHWSVRASGISSLLAILLQRQLYPVRGRENWSYNFSGHYSKICHSLPVKALRFLLSKRWARLLISTFVKKFEIYRQKALGKH